jgi:monoamine oxidase
MTKSTTSVPRRGRSARAPHDVIIIGAGAAGLAAAAELARAGASALVLEARERLGGRIWSHQEPGLPVPVELGAEFIHGCAAVTFDLLARAASAAIDTAGEHWSLRHGKLQPSDDLFTGIRHAIGRGTALAKKDMSLDTYLDGPMRDALSDEARAYARMLAQGFDAADTARASARAIVEEWTGGASVEAPQFRPLGGYGAMLSRLASELRGREVELQLNTTVHSVRWKRGSVSVEGTSHGTRFAATAKRAILTLPLGVLQRPSRAADAVRFTPALTQKRDALAHLAPGPVLKVLLRFRRAFWDEIDGGRYRNGSFFHDRNATFPTFWNTLPVRTPLLVAWAAGPNALKLAGATKERIIAEALVSARSTFGPQAKIDALLEAAWVHDWQNDPLARGAYSYVVVGGDKAREDLAKPLLRTLYFAGEAADSEEAGTVAGALRSGIRAAKAVLAERVSPQKR